MLRAIQRYKRTIFGLIIVGLIATSMLGFGVNMYSRRMGTGSRNNNYAMKIDGTEISFDKLYRERKNLEQRYRQMFGKQYEQMRGMLNVNQTTVDNLISQTLLDHLASNDGFVTGTNEVRSFLQNSVFPNGFDQNAYNNFLSQMRMTAQEFETEIKDDLTRQQVSSLFRQISAPSQAEVKKDIERDYTKYTVDSVSFDPKNFIASVPARSEDELKRYYDEASTEFELPGKVSYDYLVINEANFPDAVPVTEDEIGLYYTDHESSFKTPEERHVFYIQLLYPKDAKPEQKAGVKKHAEETLAKLDKGEAFDVVAKAASDDAKSRDKGGDLGFIAKGALAKELDAQIFRLKVDDKQKMLETPQGYYIAKVAEIKEPQLKALETVKDEIVRVLKKENAPAFLAAKAQELYEKWAKTDVSLSDFLKTENIPPKSTNGLIDATNDPEAFLKGLSNEAFEAKDQKQQLVELTNAWVLVALKDSKEETLATFDSVKDKIINKFKEEDAKKAAQTAAAAFLSDLKQKKIPSLKDGAASQKLFVKTFIDFSRAAPAKDLPGGPFSDAIFAVSAAPAFSEKPIEENGQFSIFEVTSVTAPPASAIEENLATYAQRAKSTEGDALLAAILNKMKANAEKDINARALAEG
jgi:peptidyl-prolyl cis-trans isomerase D